jgi:hypothetical protein
MHVLCRGLLKLCIPSSFFIEIDFPTTPIIMPDFRINVNKNILTMALV